MAQNRNAFIFFLRRYPIDTIFVICLLLIAGASEALGVIAFLPFLQIFIDGQEEIKELPFKLANDFIQTYDITLNFKTIGIFIILTISIKAGILWLAMRRVSHTVSKVAEDFRNTYIKSLLLSQWSFLVNHPLGESLNSISTETFRASQTFISNTKFIAALIQVSIYTVSAFILSWKACLAILLMGLIIILMLWVFVRESRSAGAKQTNILKNMMKHMGDIIQGIKPLRAMALENFFLNRLYSLSKELKISHYRQMLSGQSLRIFHEPLMVIGAILGIFLAMKFGNLEGSSLIVIMVFFLRIITGLNTAQSEYQRGIKEESALWSLIQTIQTTKKLIEKDTGKVNCPHPINLISFQDVSFSHGQNEVLKNVSLLFKKQTFTVLMGQSGSGKTTILDLLSGFIVPSKGKILINNMHLNDIKKQDWRKKIGFMPQEVFLFNETIRDNILMGRTHLSDEDIWNSLYEAEASDFVKNLPDGLGTYVGENGRRLSGGQKQRIAIARAIVNKPEILLLDEATSALDTRTQKELLSTFKRLSKKMMVIMVSHSEMALKYSEQIIRIKNGKIKNNE